MLNELTKTTTKDIYKLVIAGSVGAGKTSAIKALSDKEVVSTEENASDSLKKIKKTTTVAMDYGVMQLETGESVRLYGTPGQDRFDFMWEILSENALGLILLVNAKDEDPVKELAHYLEKFTPLVSSSAMVVGVTHAEQAPWDLHQRLSDYLSSINVAPNVCFVDARDKSEMRELVKSMIYMLI